MTNREWKIMWPTFWLGYCVMGLLWQIDKGAWNWAVAFAVCCLIHIGGLLVLRAKGVRRWTA